MKAKEIHYQYGGSQTGFGGQDGGGGGGDDQLKTKSVCIKSQHTSEHNFLSFFVNWPPPNRKSTPFAECSYT
jgi:hypothetical protein